jgi:hypothetical protein
MEPVLWVLRVKDAIHEQIKHLLRSRIQIVTWWHEEWVLMVVCIPDEAHSVQILAQGVGHFGGVVLAKVKILPPADPTPELRNGFVDFAERVLDVVFVDLARVRNAP